MGDKATSAGGVRVISEFWGLEKQLEKNGHVLGCPFF